MGAIDGGRAMAEELMVDVVEVEYQTGSAVQDETTGKELPIYAVRFTSAGRFVGDELHIPAMGPVAWRGDRVRVTFAGVDPSLLGRKFYVIGDQMGSHATARRYKVEAARSS